MTTAKQETNGVANGQSKALATRKPSPGEMLKAEFDQWKPTLRAVLPKHLDAERIVKMALSAYMRSPDLQDCSRASVIKATIMAAEMGLEPGGLLGESYLVPFNNKKKVRDGNVLKDVVVREASLIPGYKGLVKLARQTGDIAGVYSCVVDESEAETFRVVLGTKREIVHDMNLTGRTGRVFAAYAVIQFKDGSEPHFEVMTKSEIDAVMQRSKASGSGPWQTDYAEMAKKTVLKRALKMITLSPERPHLATAVAADNSADQGESFNTDLTAAIDVEGTAVEELAQEPAKAISRSDELAKKLGSTVAHDPVTGEVTQ